VSYAVDACAAVAIVLAAASAATNPQRDLFIDVSPSFTDALLKARRF